MAPGNIILDIILLGTGCQPCMEAGKPGVSGYTCPKNKSGRDAVIYGLCQESVPVTCLPAISSPRTNRSCRQNQTG